MRHGTRFDLAAVDYEESLTALNERMKSTYTGHAQKRIHIKEAAEQALGTSRKIPQEKINEWATCRTNEDIAYHIASWSTKKKTKKAGEPDKGMKYLRKL